MPITGAPGTLLGRALTTVDLDLDGTMDVLVADADISTDGQLLAWFGPISGAHLPEDADLHLTGGDVAGINAYEGRLDAAGDLDGDGHGDALLGDPAWTNTTGAVGAAFPILAGR